MLYLPEEIKLVNEVLEIMEIDVEEDGKHQLLKKNFLPLVLNGKQLINITENLRDFDRSVYITFRPITNGKHVQLLMDFIYEYDDDVVAEILSIKKDDGTFEVRLIGHDDEIVLSATSLKETSAKFLVFYKYYFEKDCSEDLNKIIINEDKIRAYQQKKKEEREMMKKNNKKQVRKVGRK